LALVQLPRGLFGVDAHGGAKNEMGTVTCLRSVLMKPEHEAWIGEIWERLSGACDEVLG
jgi:tyrosine decarboxylase / aspartate 1-decarboxylase